MTIEILRARVTSLRQAQEESANATSILLAYERRGSATMVELHAAVRNLADSMQNVRRCQVSLLECMAVDPANLDEPLDELVPPLLEGSTE